MTKPAPRKPTSFAASKQITKSEAVKKIVRVVRQHRLSYDGFIAVCQQVRIKLKMEKPKKERRLPELLSLTELKKFFRTVRICGDTQHELMLKLMLYTAVRVSELVNIQCRLAHMPFKPSSIILPLIICTSIIATAGCAKLSDMLEDKKQNKEGNAQTAGSGTIRLVLPNQVRSTYIIPLAKPPVNLSQEFLISAKRHLDNESSEAVRKLVTDDVLEIGTISAKEFQLPDAGLLTATGSSKEDLSAFQSAQNFAVLTLSATPKWPALNNSLVRTAASAYASDYHCSVLDLSFPVIRSASEIANPSVPSNGKPCFSKWLTQITSQDKNGIWYTTKGMDFSGLPELQLMDAPVNISASLARIITGVGWKLVCLSKNRKKVGNDTIIEIPTTIHLTAADIDEAYQAPMEAKGSIDISLRFDKGDTNESSDFLTIQPPPGAASGEYLTSICTQLFDLNEDKIVYSKRTSEMNEAIAKAKGTLSDTRARFINGKLPQNAMLAVKFPFEYKGDTEFLWAFVNAWEKPEVLNCHCVNNSDLAPAYKIGQQIELKADSIVDWLVQVNGKTVEGGFTNEVLKHK
ncbi:hypothetical protein BH11CYA1_BH11CYA1_16320 [soil metagenome]